MQFCINQERLEKRDPTSKTIGLDVGLTHFYTDSDGHTVENPRHLRKSEKSLQRLSRRMSKTKKGSKNRAKFRKKLARKHLKVSRQRKDSCLYSLWAYTRSRLECCSKHPLYWTPYRGAHGNVNRLWRHRPLFEWGNSFK
ncbi:MAG: transposase [Hydrococcus sp. Prado102]|nr:transposase [Hydrococcus sp. Prado102]